MKRRSKQLGDTNEQHDEMAHAAEVQLSQRIAKAQQALRARNCTAAVQGLAQVERTMGRYIVHVSASKFPNQHKSRERGEVVDELRAEIVSRCACKR